MVAQTQRVCSGLEQHSSLILIFFPKCVAFQGSPWISEGRAVLQLLQSSMKGTFPTKVLCSLKPLATIRDKIVAQIAA